VALGATWFAGTGTPNYTDIRCDADFTSASSSSTTSGSYIRYDYTPCGWLIFLPNKAQTNGGNLQDPEYGYVYATKDSDSSEVSLRNIYHDLRSAPAISRSTDQNMYRPFDDDQANSRLRIVLPTGGADTCSVYIYQPFAWYGRCAEVIAAVLLVKGVSAGSIDQTAFSAADDAQAAMGSSDDEEPFVFYRRQIGQSLGEAIKQLAVNSWDILTVNLDGEVALMPRTSVPAGFTVSSLDREDGVVSVNWRYAREMLVNHTVASEGRYYDVTFEQVGTFNNIPMLVSEVSFPSAASKMRSLPFEEFEDSTSQTRYGLRSLGREMELQEGPDVRTIRSYHLPYLCNVEGSSGDPVAAKTVLMARLADVEAQLRREITVVQDLRGLDYDVGYLVEDVELTSDGAEIDEMFCIKKTIDFNDLSVTSVLLEEPS